MTTKSWMDNCNTQFNFVLGRAILEEVVPDEIPIQGGAG